MKDFNIENLERKNLYKTPDNFFDEVQKNVLDRVGKEEIKNNEGKVIPLFNRWYLAAACVAVLAGGLFLTNSNFGATEEVNTLAQAQESKTKNTDVTEQSTTTVEEKKLITFVNDVESVLKEEAQPVRGNREVPEKTTTLASSSKAEFSHIEMEQFIESMSQEDISKITQNNNQDIYLDLYY